MGAKTSLAVPLPFMQVRKPEILSVWLLQRLDFINRFRVESASVSHRSLPDSVLAMSHQAYSALIEWMSMETRSSRGGLPEMKRLLHI